LYQDRLGTNIGKALKKKDHLSHLFHCRGGVEVEEHQVEMRLAARCAHQLRQRAQQERRTTPRRDDYDISLRANVSICNENTSLSECFPYVCPEPVLVKRSSLA
jgi:hypothetical protein